MLKKINRLQRKKDFQKVFKGGNYFEQDFLTFKIIQNNLKNSRFGFVVPKSVFKKANKRNSLKRKLREIIRVKIKEQEIVDGIDGVLIIKREPKEINFNDLKRAIEKLFLKACIIKPTCPSKLSVKAKESEL